MKRAGTLLTIIGFATTALASSGARAVDIESSAPAAATNVTLSPDKVDRPADPSGVADASSTDVKAAPADFYQARRQSDSARGRLEAYGLTLKTQIDGTHYVVYWGLGDTSRTDGNAKIDFEEALRDVQNSLEVERASLHQFFGTPKTQNELIFAADLLGRLELVTFTLDSLASLPSFNRDIEWMLGAHAVLTLPTTCEDCAAPVVVLKLEHYDVSHFDFDITSDREVLNLDPKSGAADIPKVGP